MSRIDPTELDRLVDGQLGEPQRRDLLTQLEREPDGWRRCALAFLEAQSWKEIFGATVRSASESPVPESPVPEPPAESPSPVRARGPRRRMKWGTPVAMAASFLLAFGLGLLLRTGLMPGPTAPGTAGQVVESEPVSVAPSTPILPRSETPVAIPVAETNSAAPWKMVRIPVGQRDGSVQWVEVPAVASDRADDAWRSSSPGVLTPEMVRNLQAAGLNVHQSRQMVPVPMEGGGRVVVPVDDVDVQYVGGPAYQ